MSRYRFDNRRINYRGTKVQRLCNECGIFVRVRGDKDWEKHEASRKHVEARNLRIYGRKKP